jgi:hypothetical protein
MTRHLCTYGLSATTAAPTPGPKQNKGGRPPHLTDAVTPWFKALSPKNKALSAHALAESWEADGNPGSSERVRKIIGVLKKPIK